MVKKSKVEKSPRKVESKQVITSKRQLSKWEREGRRRRIIEIVIVVTIVAVLGLIGYGYYNTRIKPWHQPILRVNDKVLNMDYYVKMLRLVRQFGGGQMDSSTAQSVVEWMEESELYRQAAKSFGIIDNVTAADKVDAKLQEWMANSMTMDQLQAALKNSTISEAEFKQMVIEPMLLQEGLQDYVTSRELEQVRVQAMLLGTEEEAQQVVAEWNAGGNFTQIAAAANETYSISHVYDNETLPRGIESTAFDNATFNSTLNYVILQHDTSYSTTGGYWLINMIEKNETAEQVHLQGILFDSRREAEEIASNITNYGGNFTQLATEYSLHSSSKANGGDLSWVNLSDVGSTLGIAADMVGNVTGLNTGELSEPIFSGNITKYGGYWLIKVLDKQVWPLSDEHREKLMTSYFNDWFQNWKNSSTIVNYLELDPKKLTWALGHV